MLFLSQLTLGYKDLQVLKISDEYSIHRVIYSLFEDYRSNAEKTSSVKSGFLYAEQKSNSIERRFLILSDRAPNIRNEKIGTVITKKIPENFLKFSQYRFRLLVNPTIRDKNTGKLKPVIGETNISVWFAEKSVSSWGFATSDLNVTSIVVLNFKGKNGNLLTISRAEIEGTLTVTNFELFASSFAHGIGRAHAFGCGLLQLVPIYQ